MNCGHNWPHRRRQARPRKRGRSVAGRYRRKGDAMNYQALLDSIASGAVASGDLQSWKPGPAGPDALEQGIQAFTGQPEIHSTVLLRLTDRILDIFQAVNLTFVGTTWGLVEST